MCDHGGERASPPRHCQPAGMNRYGRGGMKGILTNRIYIEAKKKNKNEAGHPEDKGVTSVRVKAESSRLIIDKAQKDPQPARGQACSPSLGCSGVGTGGAAAVGLLQPQPITPSSGGGMRFCMVSTHGMMDPGRTLSPLRDTAPPHCASAEPWAPVSALNTSPLANALKMLGWTGSRIPKALLFCREVARLRAASRLRVTSAVGSSLAAELVSHD